MRPGGLIFLWMVAFAASVGVGNGVFHSGAAVVVGIVVSTLLFAVAVVLLTVPGDWD